MAKVENLKKTQPPHKADFLILKSFRDSILEESSELNFRGVPFIASGTGNKVFMLLQKSKPTIEVITLVAIFFCCFFIRQFAVIRYESMIHEFDPYFNWRSTQYMFKNGYYEFWNWFDTESWYPIGRSIGTTIFPGLMTTAFLIHKALHAVGILVELIDICVYMGPLFGGLTALIVYAICKEITGSRGTALFGALFAGISPAYLSRSVAGSYDNESVAIFGMLLAFYTWIRAINTGTMLSALVASFGSFYIISSWGAYIFVINTIAVYMVAIAFLNKLTIKHHLVYTVYYIITTCLSFNIPFIAFEAIKSSEHMSSHGMFIVVNTILLSYHLKEVLSEHKYKIVGRAILYLTIGGFMLLFIFLTTMGKTGWSARYLSMLDPSNTNADTMIVSSISEHQAPIWSAYLFDLHITFLLAPVGIWVSLSRWNDGAFFIVIYSILAAYFSGMMVRIMLVLSPAAAILSAIGASYITENLVNSIRTRSMSALAFLNKKLSKQDYESATTSSVDVIKPLLAIGTLILLAAGCFLYVFHSTWASAIAYSHPSIVSKLYSSDGRIVMQDDFREAFAWFRYNTHENARIMSWWDYGYQTSGLGKRTVIVDNNTRNTTHIAIVGLAFSSNESDAFAVVRKLDVDYVFVVFGGLIGYGSDDINKFLWMVRISSGFFPGVQQSDYFNAQSQYTVAADSTETMFNSLMYQMSYREFHKINGGIDRTRNVKIGRFVETLENFEEVYTTEHWVVRIYKVKRPPFDSNAYSKNVSPQIKRHFNNDKIF